VKQNATLRARHRRVRAALGLVAFAFALVLGNAMLVARAFAVAGPQLARASVTHEVSSSSTSKCGKARAIAHAKHIRPHVASAAVDDDDDDDDDGGFDALRPAVDELATLPTPGRAIAEAVESAREITMRPLVTRVATFEGSPHEARGPPGLG
jgi:hypothetical protein